MKRIGILTSGGDNPGLNPCIRAVVRMGIHLGIEIMGIRRGFAGLIDGEIDEMDARSVGGIMAQGGTIQDTARCPEFYDPKGQLAFVHVGPYTNESDLVKDIDRYARRSGS